MRKADLVVNKGFEQPEKIFIDTGKLTQKLVEEKRTSAIKLRELPKENSFTSYTTISSSDSVGRRWKCKVQNLCGIACLCLALAACIIGCYIMWATDLFMLFVHQNVVITNNSMRYEAWKAPPVNAFLRVYIFNYTNVYEFENEIDSKLKISELGPYTYIEKWERVDVRFNKNGTATYRDRKTYIFSPEHSQGKESDIVIVPNLPFLSALALTSNLFPVLRWPLIRIMANMGAKRFIRLNASNFLWGYEDKFASVARNILSMRYDLPFDKFGILSAKNGTQKDLVTIYTGEEDTTKTGIVASYDGKTSLNYWNSKECNRIDGTDGTIYPPSLIHPNSTLYIYSKDLCRKLPLTYSDKYLDKHGIEVMRFRIPSNVFASGRVEKDNLCFCSKMKSEMKCLPSGIFNVSPCVFNAPLVTSLPHFLYGDEILTKGVEGLNPEIERHESFVEVDPKLGIPVGGKSRFQLNIMLRGKHETVRLNQIYQNQIVFPITWMDYGVDKLPDDVSTMIRNLILFIKAAQFCLSYGFIVCTIVFGILFINGCCAVPKLSSLRGCHSVQKEEIQSQTPLFVINEKR